MSQKLLVLSAAIGAGHLKAAEALCQTFERLVPNGKAVHLDFLKYCGPRFSRLIEESYYFITKYMAGIYRLLYEIADKPDAMAKRNQILLALRKYRDFIHEYRPDLILSTHFFPASVVSHYYPKYPVKNGVILTDYEAHPMWVYPNVHCFFVAHPGMVEELVHLGVPAGKVRVTGIPIRPEFSHDFVLEKLRAEKGVPEGVPVLLVMSGGNAIGPLDEVLASLNQITGEFYTIVITGKNEKVRRELEERRDQFRFPLKVLGYVEDMHKWMRLSDLLISKAGGLTVSEVLAVGLPLLVVKPTPGQEEANARYLVEYQAGIYVKNSEELGSVLGELLSNRTGLQELKKNALMLGKPEAATAVIQEMMKESDYPPIFL
ncbi:MAG TPA: glycosyltransferase [Firmicutes bacterium]|nr:glycosyltransferase [Bacillota bacterium]